MKPEFWKNKRVLITGHTGFKGSWACLMLSQLNADVFGIALPPDTPECLYEAADIQALLSKEFLIDITNISALTKAVKEIQPDVIIHMAAQSLVHYSYDNPVETFNTNIMGTINLFEAIRLLDKKCAIVNVTSDKCYENQEWLWPYRENEPMGGHDPYSCSKGCSELITASYRNSYFSEGKITLASARAGNVVGGGDWAQNRLLPDIFRAHCSNTPLVIRSPHAIRPWQFVLEPVSGYLVLAQHLYDQGSQFAQGWNFGPSDEATQTVSWIVENFLNHLSSDCQIIYEDNTHHEATLLKLDSNKAKALLNWRPRLDIDTCLAWTAEWYGQFEKSGNMRDVSMAQVSKFLTHTSKG